jgi:hypothetical protein
MPFPLEGHFFRFSPNCEGYFPQAAKMPLLLRCRAAQKSSLRSPRTSLCKACGAFPQNKDFKPILSVSTCAFLSPIF